MYYDSSLMGKLRGCARSSENSQFEFHSLHVVQRDVREIEAFFQFTHTKVKEYARTTKA